MRDQAEVDFLNSTRYCARRCLNSNLNVTDHFHLELKRHPVQLAAEKTTLRKNQDFQRLEITEFRGYGSVET